MDVKWTYMMGEVGGGGVFSTVSNVLDFKCFTTTWN